MRIRLIKFLALTCCSGVLLSIQCPPLVIQSFKTGISSWVSGGPGTAALSQIGDLILGGLISGNTPGT